MSIINDEIHVHIASPARIINLGIHDFPRLSTLYFNSYLIPNIHMFPNEIIKHCSLLPDNIPRPVITFIFNRFTKKFIKIDVNNYIINNEALEYDTERVKQLFNYYDIKHKDSHKWVEYWMTKVNIICAEILKDVPNMIFRAYDGPTESSVFSSYKGYYTTDKTKKHNMFGDFGELYTHATSPLRRYVDYYVHQLLYNYEMSKNDIKMSIDLINEQSRLFKRAQNEIEMVKRFNEYRGKVIRNVIAEYDKDLNVWFCPNYNIMLYNVEFYETVKDKLLILNGTYKVNLHVMDNYKILLELC